MKAYTVDGQHVIPGIRVNQEGTGLVIAKDGEPLPFLAIPTATGSQVIEGHKPEIIDGRVLACEITMAGPATAANLMTGAENKPFVVKEGQESDSILVLWRIHRSQFGFMPPMARDESRPPTGGETDFATEHVVFAHTMRTSQLLLIMPPHSACIAIPPHLAQHVMGFMSDDAIHMRRDDGDPYIFTPSDDANGRD